MNSSSKFKLESLNFEPASGIGTQEAARPQQASSGRADVELEVSGMTCQNCARHVREALEAVPGVGSAVVSLPNHRASVRWQAAGPPPLDAMLRSLEQAGYPARVVESHDGHAEHECHSRAWEINLWIGV